MSQHRSLTLVFGQLLCCVMLQQDALLFLPPWPPLPYILKQLLQCTAPEELCEYYLQTTKKRLYVGCLHTVNREGTSNKSDRRQDREERQYPLGAGHGNRSRRDSQEPLENLGWMLSFSFPMRREELFSHNFDPKFFFSLKLLSGLYMAVPEFSQPLLMVIWFSPHPLLYYGFLCHENLAQLCICYKAALLTDCAYSEADPLGSGYGWEPMFAQCYFHDVKIQTRDYTLIMMTYLNGIHSSKQQLERSRTCQ